MWVGKQVGREKWEEGFWEFGWRTELVEQEVETCREVGGKVVPLGNDSSGYVVGDDYDVGSDVDDADGDQFQLVVSLTHHVLSPSLNLTHCLPHTYVYVSLLGYLVSHHHLPIQLHVQLRLRSRVFLCGKGKEKV